MAYGQHYKKNDKFYNVQHVIQIRPFDENKEYVRIDDFIWGGSNEYLH